MSTTRSQSHRRATGRRLSVWDRILMHDIGLVNLLAGGRGLLCVPAGMAAGYAVATFFGLPASVGLLLGALPAFLSCFVIVDRTGGRVAARSAALYVPFVIALLGSMALHQYRVLELAIIVVMLFAQFYAMKFSTWVSDFFAALFAAYLCGLLLPLPLSAFAGLAFIFAASLAATILVRSVVFHPNAYRSLMRSRRAFVAWESRVLEAAIDALDSDEGVSRRALARLRRRRQQAHEAGLVADGMLAAPGTGQTAERAEQLHRLLFDTESAIDALARVSAELIESDTPRVVRRQVARALELVHDQGGRHGDDAARDLLRWADSSTVVAADTRTVHTVNRVALLLSDLAASADDWAAVRRELPRSGDGVPFQSPVALLGGRIVGAGPVLHDTIANSGHTRVSPALRTAIQAAISVAIVEPLAYALDAPRFYWGVIGVMVVLAGTNSTHERVRKTVNRAIGTVIGGAIGIALVHVLGTDHIWWTLSLVVFCLAAGMYGFGRSYVFWVMGLVIVLCQVYESAGGFSDGVIAFRLAENVLGAVVAVLVSAFVMPVATNSMIRRAILRQLATVKAFVVAAGDLPAAGGVGAAGGLAAARSLPSAGGLAGASGLTGARSLPSADGLAGAGAGSTDLAAAAVSATRLRGASRAVDQATYQLQAVFKPLVRFPTGGGARREDATRTALVAVAGFARSVAYRVERQTAVPTDVVQGLTRITTTLATSIDALSSAVARSGNSATKIQWLRVSDLIDELDRDLDAVARISPADAAVSDGKADPDRPGSSSESDLSWLRFRIHTLGRIDDALAQLGESYGLSADGTPSGDLVSTRQSGLTASTVRRRFSS